MPLGDEVRYSPPIAIGLSDLEPGDILLMRTSKDTSAIQYVIMFLQMFTSEEHGHYDTTHAAVCIGHDERGPVIAHIGPGGYAQEPLIGYDTDERAFLVFRLFDRDAREELARTVSDKENEKLIWHPFAAILPLFLKARLNPERELQDEKLVSSWTICSQFVIKCMKIAALNRDGKGYPDIRSKCTPKGLEAFLTYNPDYQTLVYLGKEPYLSIKNKIREHLDVIDSPGAWRLFKEITGKIEASSHKVNELYQLLTLLKVMMPVLESYMDAGSVAGLARKIGIFARDIESFQLKDVAKTMGLSPGK